MIKVKSKNTIEEMEFFIPGLLLFLLFLLIAFFLVPKATPMITAILSIIFLTYGVHEHYRLFATEYRLSTWQDSLKIYAPALMIAAIIVFIIYFMLSLFTGGSVPVPSMPNIEIPTMEDITTNISNTFNNATNAISNGLNFNTNTNRNNNKLMNTLMGNNNTKTNNFKNNNSEFRKSILEAL
jgi:predicted PurR-regulated permease PerM